MDCLTAQLVYLHENPIGQIQSIFPEAWTFLEKAAYDFTNNNTNKFNDLLHNAIGQKPYQYHSEYRNGDSKLSHDLQELIGDLTSRTLLEHHFSKLTNKSIYFGLLCCDSHISTDKPLSLHDCLLLQRAAIQIEIN
ncbi:MAG: hypothetical protein ACRCXZ_01745 [Patescibacteria group bacterium]